MEPLGLCDQLMMYYVLALTTLTFILAAVPSLILTFYIMVFTNYWWVMIVYIIWIAVDQNTCETGGRSFDWLRQTRLMKSYKHYFPTKTHRVEGCDLDKSKNYLFVAIPHGFMLSGFTHAMVSMFPSVFVHHDFNICTFDINFSIPFHREVCYATGMISCSAKSIRYMLNWPGGGKVVGLNPGGAQEAWVTQPGVYKTIINKRKGFVKLALECGASLVPVVNFGEVDTYNQITGPRLRKLQAFWKNAFGIPLLFPRGRGPIQPSIIPLRKPVNVVVGKPMDVPKVSQPTQEQIDGLHARFLVEMETLFEEHKHKFLENPADVHLEYF